MTKDKIKEKMQDAIEKLEDCVDALRINMKLDGVNADCVLCGAAAASAMINCIVIKTEYAENNLDDIPLAEATVMEDTREDSIACKFEFDAKSEGRYRSAFEERYKSLVSHDFCTFDGCAGSTHLYIFEDGSAVEYRSWKSDDWCSWIVLNICYTDIKEY